ncbi:hypothetical protein ACJDU8_16415 [Clostridium sp. WILCCON 0269]|uniref:Uncharacterized protein n=1 Tax=Candidatus Clostridium eludens TaxID=3381663 RepID=A0ABW8SN16_9CLOT
MKRFKALLLIIVILIFIVSFIEVKGSLIENLEVPVGVSVDIDKDSVIPRIDYLY